MNRPPERCGTPGLNGLGYPRLLSAESSIALALKYMEQATYTAARAPSSASFPNQRAAIMPVYAQRRKGNNALSTIIFSRQFTWHLEQVQCAEKPPRLWAYYLDICGKPTCPQCWWINRQAAKEQRCKQRCCPNQTTESLLPTLADNLSLRVWRWHEAEHHRLK